MKSGQGRADWQKEADFSVMVLKSFKNNNGQIITNGTVREPEVAAVLDTGTRSEPLVSSPIFDSFVPEM